MRHLFVAKFFEPSYAKARTNHFERPDPCGVVLALGDAKGRFSVIRTGLFFLSHGLAIRRLLLSVTPENAPEGTLAPRTVQSTANRATSRAPAGQARRARSTQASSGRFASGMPF